MSSAAPIPPSRPSRSLTVRPLPPVDLERRHAAAAALREWLEQTDDYDEQVGAALELPPESMTMRCADDHAHS